MESYFRSLRRLAVTSPESLVFPFATIMLGLGLIVMQRPVANTMAEIDRAVDERDGELCQKFGFAPLSFGFQSCKDDLLQLRMEDRGLRVMDFPM